MHFLSLPFGSACNFLVSPFFYNVISRLYVDARSLRLWINRSCHPQRSFHEKKEDFFLFFLSLYSQTLFETNLFSNRKTMGIGRKFPRVKEGKLHPSYVLIEIRLKLRILHVKWYLKIIGGSWPGTTFFPLFTGPCPTRSKVWRVVSR